MAIKMTNNFTNPETKTFQGLLEAKVTKSRGKIMIREGGSHQRRRQGSI